MKCTACRLHKTCINPLQMGIGKKGARIMVVQENPYEMENKRKIYMGGKAGRMFRAALGEVGIDIDDVYYTAVVKCSSPEDRLPFNDEVKACQDYLFAEIETIKPEIIVPTGNISIKLLMGVTGITKHRGKMIEKDGIKYLPIIHPNLVLKQPKYLGMFSEDMITLESILNGTKVESRVSLNKERKYCETYEDAIAEINRLMNLPSGSRIALDLETVKTNPYLEKTVISDRMKTVYPESEKVKICAIGFSDRAGYGCSIPLYHRENTMPGNQIGAIIKSIRQLLMRDDIEFIGQNSKFEIGWLRQHFGVLAKGFVWDTMLMHYIAVTEEKGTHGLDDFAWLYTDMGGYDSKLNEVKPRGELDEGNYDMIDWDILKVYLADDCDVTMRAFDIFYPLIIENKELKWIWDNLMLPGYYTLHEIERNGIHVNRDWLETLKEEYPKEIQRLEDKLHEYPEVVEMEREWKSMWAERIAIGQIRKVNRTKEQQNKFERYKKYDPSKGGCTFNFSSTKQLQELLFDRMGLKTVVLTDKGNLSTNDDSLKYMKDQHPICELLLEYRKVKHLYNNFVSTMEQHLDKNDIIHPSYNLHGTVTGRLSSDNPNAQQFPRKVYDPFLFQYWHEIKSLFTSRFGEDGVMLQFDYSQLELRILAVFSQDENLIQLYKSGADLHKATASGAFNVPIEEVTKEQRTAAKKIGFGIVYQESPHGLSEDLRSEGIDLSEQDCERFIANYFKRFPKVEKWILGIKRFAKRNKYVKTLTNRIRHLPTIDSSEKSIANEALRQAVNAPIQSTGSDCTLQSLIQINKWLKETGKRSMICVTVHDSIVLDCPKDEAIEVAKKVKHIMENLAEYNEFYKFLGEVPIVSEMEIGYDYGCMFECSIEDIEKQGIDGFLQAQLKEKKDKELEAFKEAEKEGRIIPPYVRGYWQK